MNKIAVAAFMLLYVTMWSVCIASDLPRPILNDNVSIEFGVGDNRYVRLSNNRGEIKDHQMPSSINFNDLSLGANFEAVSPESAKSCFKINSLVPGGASRIVLKTKSPSGSIAINCGGAFAEIVLCCRNAFVFSGDKRDGELRIRKLVAGVRSIPLIVDVGFQIGGNPVNMGSYILTKEGLYGWMTTYQIDVVARRYQDFAGIESVLDCDDRDLVRELGEVTKMLYEGRSYGGKTDRDSNLPELVCLCGVERAKEILKGLIGKVLSFADPDFSSYPALQSCQLVKSLVAFVDKISIKKDSMARDTLDRMDVWRFLYRLNSVHEKLGGYLEKASKELPRYCYELDLEEFLWRGRDRVFVLKKDGAGSDKSVVLSPKRGANVEDFKKYLLLCPYRDSLEKCGSVMERVDEVKISIANDPLSNPCHAALVSRGSIFAEVAKLKLCGGKEDLAMVSAAVKKCAAVWARGSYNCYEDPCLDERISLHGFSLFGSAPCSTYARMFNELWQGYLKDLDFDIRRTFVQ
jgi:hypothetical protein